MYSSLQMAATRRYSSTPRRHTPAHQQDIARIAQRTGALVVKEGTL